MTQSAFSRTVHRAHKLHRLLERELRRPDAPAWRLMRLKALQLKLQSRLAELLAPRTMRLRPVRIASHRRPSFA